jgi:hypothetical protein
MFMYIAFNKLLSVKRKVNTKNEFNIATNLQLIVLINVRFFVSITTKFPNP